MISKYCTWCMILCTFYLLLNANYSIAQKNCDYTLSCITKEEHKSDPLPYAVIKILELDAVITSDDEGHYILEKLCKGNYTLVCSFLGFKTDTQTVFMDKSKGVFFNLHPENCELDEVVVLSTNSSSIIPIKQLPMMLPRKSEIILQSNKTTAGLITRNISGGSSLNTGSNTAKPVFHGLHSNRLKIIQNGIPIENQQWGAEHGLDLGDFENPTMNNSSFIYHDAIGGVLTSYSSVGVTNFKDWRDYKNGDEYAYYTHHVDGKISTEVNSNGKSSITGGYLTGNFKKAPYLGWKVFGGIGRGGDAQTPTYNLKNTGFSNYNYGYQSKIDCGRLKAELYYKNVFQKSGISTGSHIGNTTDFYKAVSADKPNLIHTGDFSYTIGGPFQQINHEMFSGQVLYDNEKEKFNKTYHLRYSRQYNKRQEFDVHDLENADLHLELTTHHLIGGMLFDLDSNSFSFKYGRIGFTSMYQKNTWQNSQFVPNYLKKKAGVNIGYENYKLFKKNLSMKLYFLYDIDQTDVYILDKRIIEEQNLLFHSPSANVEFATKSKGKSVIKENVKYRYQNNYTLGFASTWRAPAINELYSGGIHHSAASLEFGNPDLKRENSYKTYLKFQRPVKKYDLATTFHSNLMQNYIYSAPTGNVLLTTKGAFPEYTYQQTDALLSGVDFDFLYYWSKRVKSLTKSTFIHAYDFDESNGLIGIPANRIEQSITYSLLKSNRKNKLNLSIGGSYFLRQYNSNLKFELVNPPKEYFLLDAGLTYELKFNKKDKYNYNYIKINFEIINMLNSEYRDYMNRNRFFVNEIGRNFKFSLEIPFNIVNKKHEN